MREFLGTEYSRLVKYVAGLEAGSVRGRTVSVILNDSALRAEFAREVREWADGYTVPTFSRDERNLVKLRSFLLACCCPAAPICHSQRQPSPSRHRPKHKLWHGGLIFMTRCCRNWLRKPCKPTPASGQLKRRFSKHAPCAT